MAEDTIEKSTILTYLENEETIKNKKNLIIFIIEPYHVTIKFSGMDNYLMIFSPYHMISVWKKQILKFTLNFTIFVLKSGYHKKH